jgi:hypothetical protein
MKKILFAFLILASVTLLGAGCVWFGAEEEVVTNVAPETETNTNASSDLTSGWEVYRDEPWAIEMKYPPKYKTVHDTYGWPNALIHFIEKDGAQSYRGQIETWDSEDGFREAYDRDPAFITRHPNGKNWVTVGYNPNSIDSSVDEEWALVISTFRFTSP